MAGRGGCALKNSWEECRCRARVQGRNTFELAGGLELDRRASRFNEEEVPIVTFVETELSLNNGNVFIVTLFETESWAIRVHVSDISGLWDFLGTL